MHLSYLEKKYWQSKYSLSFPRLRPFSGGLEPKVEMTDKELAQLIFAYRIFNEEVELSISTRETEKFRNNIIKLGITSISAGSKTNPGGYVVSPESLEQIETMNFDGFAVLGFIWSEPENAVHQFKKIKKYCFHEN